jgi:hypothetical protein
VTNNTSSLWLNVPPTLRSQPPSAQHQCASGNAAVRGRRATGSRLVTGFVQIVSGSICVVERLAARRRVRKMVNDLAAIDLRTWSDIGLPPIPRSHVHWALSARDLCT